MSPDPPQSPQVSRIAWLADVMEVRQPLSETNPIWLRESVITEGPPTATPERHPYCELNIILAGHAEALVETESGIRDFGTIIFLGPGVPHWGHIAQYPARSIVAYFLPSLLIEMGPGEEGVKLLRRFTAKQKMNQ